MSKIIKEFQSVYPGVEFVIHQGDYTSIQNWIKTGAIDFGFVNPNAVNGLQTITLKKGIMLAIFPENHALAQKEIVSLSDIADEPFILLEEGHYYEPLEAFQLIGKRPNIKYTIHDDYAIMTMVEAGLSSGVNPSPKMFSIIFHCFSVFEFATCLCRSVYIADTGLFHLPLGFEIVCWRLLVVPEIGD